MSRFSSISGKRNRVAAYALAGALATLLTPLMVHAETDSPARNNAEATQPAVDETIRPLRFHASEKALADLRRRITATRWPDRELVADDTQGVRLATMQKLADYWANRYDWRKVEARLNALPVIITHGWPGSVIEQLKVIDPLTNPTAHGGVAADAFDVVIPSIPGYGFSGKPRELGWDPQRVARAWAVLMDRLGYKEYVAQGGDWGDAINEQMALQRPAGLLGIHTNMPGTLPDNISAALGGGPQPTGLTGDGPLPI